MVALPVPADALTTTALVLYALVGGLDLGIGLLSLIAPRPRDRAAMLASASPWYAGSPWLLLGAMLLAGALLPARADLLRSIWPWLALMLLSLSVRWAAHAFVGRMGGLGRACAAIFGLASGSTILCQGLVLGAALGGVPTTGGPWGLALVLGSICAAGLAGAYALLGAGWLAGRADGPVRTFGREVGHAAAILVVGAVVLAGTWSAASGAAVATRWTSMPGMAIPPTLLAVVLGLVVWTWRGLWSDARCGTLARAAALILALSLGLVASMSPTGAPGIESSGTAPVVPGLWFSLPAALLAILVLIFCLVRAIGLLRSASGPEITSSPVGPSHAGRRTSTVHQNDLHLS